ncbi:MAG: patatin-like phospholipase family protein [Candidatus Paceibacterota bacterium]
MKKIDHPHQRKLGLALGSGGWRALAHVGVIKELNKAGIKVDYIAGSSAGALVGGMYAALGDIEAVENIFRENMNYRRLLYAFSDPRPKWGLFKGNKIKKIFEQYLHYQQIEDCTIPFCAMATDLLTSKVIELTKGDLGEAIRASTAVPFFLQPVKWGKMRLVDGATAVPVPVKTVRQMGAEVVIAVNLQKNHFPMADQQISAFKAAFKTYQIMLHHLAKYTQASADLVLRPDIDENGDYSNPFIGFANKKNVLVSGEKIVQDNLEEIKKLLYS